MLIGYARVSTPDQTLDMQTDALQAASCEKLFSDIASGAKTERPGLMQAIEFCREDDVLVVWKPGSTVIPMYSICSNRRCARIPPGPCC